jgi:ATP-dependent Clp protease ATP-binding subunit ClpA
MFERFTDDARATVMEAQAAARELNHAHIGTEHLLLGLLAAEGSVGQRVLTAAGITPAGVRQDIQRILGQPGRILSDEDAAALKTVGIDLDAVLARIEESFGPSALGPDEAGRAPTRGRFRRRLGGGPRFTPRSKKVLELSLREALRLKDKHIGTEHILLGIIRDGGGLAAKILHDAGANLDDLRRDVLSAVGKAA